MLLLLSLVAGGFGEAYVPSKMMVAGDAGATARNVIQFQSLFRLGFAAYVIEALCDAALTALLYLLLRPAGRELALIAVLLRIVSTAAFASSETFYFAALPILGGAHYLTTFSAGQLDSMALLSLKLYAIGGIVPTLFYGVAWVLLGHLIFVSGYLPKWLGALLAFGGLCFVGGNFTVILAPHYSSDLVLLPMGVGMLAFAFWLLIRGVDFVKWQDKAATVFARDDEGRRRPL